MAQILRPIADDYNFWGVINSGSTVWGVIDDVTPDGNTTYVADNTVANDFKVQLAGGKDPLAKSDHTVYIECFTNAASCTYIIEVWNQDDDLISTSSPISVPTSTYGTISYTIPEEDAQKILTYGDGDIGIYVQIDSLPSNSTRITQLYLSIPDPDLDQFARPDSVIIDNTNTGTLPDDIDDIFPDSGSTYVALSNAPNDDFEVGLSSITDPSTSDSHILTFNAELYLSSNFNDYELATVRLYSAGDLIDTWNVTLLGGEWRQYGRILSSSQVDNITDYSSLSASMANENDQFWDIHVTQMYFGVPAVSTTINSITTAAGIPWSTINFAAGIPTSSISTADGIPT